MPKQPTVILRNSNPLVFGHYHFFLAMLLFMVPQIVIPMKGELVYC